MAFKTIPYLNPLAGEPVDIEFKYNKPECEWDNGPTDIIKVNQFGKHQWRVTLRSPYKEIAIGTEMRLSVVPEQSQGIKDNFEKGQRVRVNYPGNNANYEMTLASGEPGRSTIGDQLEPPMADTPYEPTQADKTYRENNTVHRPSYHKVKEKVGGMDAHNERVNRHRCLATALNSLNSHKCFEGLDKKEYVDLGLELGGEFFMAVNDGFPIEEQGIKDARIDMIMKMFDLDGRDSYVDFQLEVNDVLLNTDEEAIGIEDFNKEEVRGHLNKLSESTLRLIETTRQSKHC